ncbi:MAG: site-specific DNA-methyltransferase [Candidatus Thiodiazotropha sp.]
MSTKQDEMDLSATQPEETELDKYEFEPIQGYPMLNWRGKRPFRSTQYYPAQQKEQHGPEINGWRNKIYWGDNLQVMSHLLKEYRGQVDLVYIDPPFDSKADYKLRIKIRGRKYFSDQSTFEEKQYTDIWSNDEYLQYMYERITLLRELVSNNGLILLHCDPNRGHYLKCMMDEVFGSDRFINQIVWKRSDAHNDSGQGARHLGSVHDMILLYSKKPEYNWNNVFLPLPKSTIEKWYRHIEEGTGRRFNKADMTGPGGIAKGNPVYEWNGITRAWRYSKKRMQQLDDEGRIVYTSSGMPYQKRYLDESKGVPLQDWWDDIQMVRGIQRRDESQYPTEKPESLLERIIELGSKPGSLVLDVFMGSGTTQAAAMKLGRKFIGADINLGAIQTTTKRLINIANNLETESNRLTKEEKKTVLYTGFEVYNVNHYDVFRNPLEAKDLLIEALEVQKLDANNLYHGEKDGRMVKIMPVNRIATKADLNELISGFDYKAFERRQTEKPNQPVEKLLLVCMGHEADLAATLQNEVNFKLDIEVVDILRDKSNLEFKRDAEAKVSVTGGKLAIAQFYPMNLLQKLSLMKENVDDWRELVESIMVDWNYDGAVLEPAVVDLPGKDELVSGEYDIPEDAGTIRVKITDLLSESLEVEVKYG